LNLRPTDPEANTLTTQPPRPEAYAYAASCANATAAAVAAAAHAYRQALEHPPQCSMAFAQVD